MSGTPVTGVPDIKPEKFVVTLPCENAAKMHSSIDNNLEC